MASPFPGMDPYLECSEDWPDFHTTFYTTIRAELNVRLPSGYVARIDRYVWIHEPTAQERKRLRKPDVYVVKKRGLTAGPAAPALLAPNTVILPAVRKEGDRFIRIVDVKNRRVVTVVEVLSPANKAPGPDRDAYVMKRKEYLATGVNLIEIDLLRQWPRMPWGKPAPPAAPYYILVFRGPEWPRAGIWPVSLVDPLPLIPVPLDPGVADLALPLQLCFQRAFEMGRYDEDIDYGRPPEPPLPPAEAAWARGRIVSSRGKARGKKHGTK